MKAILATLLAAALILPVMAGGARADVSVGLSSDDSGIREFHLAIGDYYRVPEKEVVVVRERHIPDDDLPVVFFIADRAHVAPDAIVDLRLRGESWMDISLHFGLGPEIYYVPVKEVVTGPPYGKAYGYYKNKPEKEWKDIRLGDDDIVNLVNLRFISKHYGYSPEQVIQLRSRGENFVRINSDIKSGKGGRNHSEVKQGHEGKGRGQDKAGANKGAGKGKGKGRNK